MKSLKRMGLKFLSFSWTCVLMRPLFPTSSEASWFPLPLSDVSPCELIKSLSLGLRLILLAALLHNTHLSDQRWAYGKLLGNADRFAWDRRGQLCGWEEVSVLVHASVAACVGQCMCIIQWTPLCVCVCVLKVHGHAFHNESFLFSSYSCSSNPYFLYYSLIGVEDWSLRLNEFLSRSHRWLQLSKPSHAIKHHLRLVDPDIWSPRRCETGFGSFISWGFSWIKDEMWWRKHTHKKGLLTRQAHLYSV